MFRTSTRDGGDETGAVMLEYGLLITGIAAAVFVAVVPLGGRTAALLNQALDLFP